MSKSGSIMISFRRKKNLCLMFKSSKRFAVKNSIPVPLKSSAKITFRLFLVSALALCTKACIRTKNLLLSCLDLFSNCHINLLC